MLRQRYINGDPGGRVKRLLLAVADVVRWPFERAAWAVERGVVWPLGERLAGWSPLRQGTGAAVLTAIAVVAVLSAAILLPAGGEGPRERVAAPTGVAIAPPPQTQTEQPEGPALQGAVPSFGVGAGVGVAKGDDSGVGTGSETAPAPSSAAAGENEGSGTPEGAATASSSRKKPVPAGPVAMKVARRFSEAFVFYEIGERPARAKRVFAETATPRLAGALGERSPRLPEDGRVPKAKVLNLVPGPRAGRAYTVSVSLLRVGLTSELRLELSKKRGQWLVTDVRG
ncbi:MAG TPA: hypothetical protein VH703_00105 [Solirubrobacterales bacterium]|jgi:hypothetical protein